MDHNFLGLEQQSSQRSTAAELLIRLFSHHEKNCSVTTKSVTHITVMREVVLCCIAQLKKKKKKQNEGNNQSPPKKKKKRGIFFTCTPSSARMDRKQSMKPS